ncbi:hypothetical protein SynBIOSE41_02345 [Synechococcus sp. BIOS-E4-1]|nr:hypothetical protein [Synechococcus sp. BIOS-E4-1]QNI54845.1 hypothetical protein SynBIOSE41_02345 [Synechococcus sp. BIOS-E4-1]
MSGSQYLKRLELAQVDEENYQTQYLKRVDVVEVLDQDGNLFPFESE